MRIGIDCREVQDFPTGIGRYFKGLLQGLQKINSKNHQFLFFFNQKIPQFIQQKIKNVISKNQNWKVIQIKSHSKSFSQHFLLPFELKKYQLDLFLTVTHGFTLFNPCKTVLVIFDLIYKHYPQNYSLKAKIFDQLLLPLALKKSSLILTDSNDAKQDVVNFFHTDPEKIISILLAPDPIFQKMENIKKENFLLFVGNRRPHKNLKRLLEAFGRVANNHRFPKQLKLLIIGDIDSKGRDQDSQGIFQTINKLGLNDKIEIKGRVDDEQLCLLYNQAFALVHPSLHEGFGLTILEAMACGCPVITSNISSMPEVAGDEATLVNPESVDSIANGIKTMLHLDAAQYQSIVEKGLKQARKFSWEKTIKETLAALEKIERNH